MPEIITTELDYVSSPVPENCVFKISPSAFPKFVDRPHAWYREEVLGENTFEYNTSSVLGTCVHYCAEKVGKNEEVDQDEIEKYIAKHAPNEDYDPDIVRSQYVNMAERLVNDYLLERPRDNFLMVEKQLNCPVSGNFYVAGTPDLVEGTKEECMLVDYKTYSSKTTPRSIPAHYKYQLLTYAWMLGKLDHNVTRVRLVYVNRFIDGGISDKTGKPLKSYYPEVTVLTDIITQDDLLFIDGLLHLCVDSLKASEEHPELLHVIWHDPRL